MPTSGCSSTSSCRLRRREKVLGGSAGQAAPEEGIRQSEDADALDLVERWNRSTERRRLWMGSFTGPGSDRGAAPKPRNREGRTRSKREGVRKEREKRDTVGMKERGMNWRDWRLPTGKRGKGFGRDGNLECKKKNETEFMELSVHKAGCN